MEIGCLLGCLVSILLLPIFVATTKSCPHCNSRIPKKRRCVLNAVGISPKTDNALRSTGQPVRLHIQEGSTTGAVYRGAYRAF